MGRLFSNPFLKALQNQVKSVPKDSPPTTYEIQVDYPFAKGSPRLLGKFAGLIILQAARDKAACIRLSFGDGKMFYTVDDTEYGMIPPPAFAMVDIIREIVNASGTSFEESGAIDVQLNGQTHSLKVECVWEKQSIQILLPSK